MRQHDTCAAMVPCRLQIYSCMGYTLTASSAAATEGYSQVLSATRSSGIPAICLASRWQNTSRIFKTTPFKTQLFCRTAALSVPLTCKSFHGTALFHLSSSSTSRSPPHRLRALIKLCNTTGKSLLLYVIFLPR